VFSAWLMTALACFRHAGLAEGSAMVSGTHVGMPMTENNVALLVWIVDSCDDAMSRSSA
jgi:hypothetical protein